MPSASAKLEKQASNEAYDPIKQIVTMVEKKVRNLEKRKAKLDAYKTDSLNGRELNEDQKNAVKKYDQVVEVLDFAKEMQKSFNSVIQEAAKLQKKVAKRELLERQQQELQRIKEVLLIQDILNSMGGDEVRKDFLSETNGAVKLTEDELNGLDELYKLVNVERNPEEGKSEFEQHLLAAAEHIQGLLDSKQKEICRTSYKSLKEIIMKVHSSGYFSKNETEEPGPTGITAVEPEIHDEAVSDVQGGSSAFAAEDYDVPPGIVDRIPQSRDENSVLMQQAGVPPAPSDKTFYQAENTSLVYSEQTRPVQDVLSVQGNLNFLQESQIEVESHMDPAAVIAHPVLPPGLPYPGTQYPTQQQAAATQVLTTHHQQQKPNDGVPPPTAGQRLTPTRMMTNTGAQSSVQQPVSVPSNISVSQPIPMQNPVNQAPDFDPARPIPTQTYTNQNFSGAIHPMMANAVPPNYASVPLAHASLPPQHMVSSGLVSRSTVAPPVVSDQNAMPMTVHSQSGGGLPSTTVLSQVNAQETKEHFANREYQMGQQQRPLDRESPQSVQTSLVTTSSQFDRGETGYQNASNTSNFGGRESYVDSTSYSSNLKRGLNSRGGGGVPRSGSAQRGGSVASRGNRASYRNQ